MLKKKLKKKIIAVALSLIIPFITIIIVATGLLSVWSFFKGIFGGDPSIEVDVRKYTTEDLIKMVDDEDLFTEDTLNAMMIDRGSLKALLQGVQDYNTNYETSRKTIECKHVYTYKKYVINPKTGDVIYNKNGEALSTLVQEVNYKTSITVDVSAKEYEGSYKLDWQPLYVFAIMETLNRYGSMYNSPYAKITKPEDTEKSKEENKEEDEDTGGKKNSDSLSEIEGNYDVPTKWDDAFVSASEETKIPVGLLKALAYCESSFRVKVVSSAGAVGLMQVKPSSAGKTREELMDPSINIMCGARYLATMIQKYDGSVVKGLCAYNHGPNYIPLVKNTLSVSDLEYSARVLSKFTDQSLSSNKLLTGSYDLSILVQSGLGYFDEETGRLKLTEAEVKMLIDDFKVKFEYDYDVVRDDKDTYTFEECSKLPNGGLQSDGGDPNSEKGEYLWYVPRSILKKATMPYEDIYYTNGVPTKYILNEERWLALISYYWASEYYDEKWLATLIKILPNGEDAIERYHYYVSLAEGSLSSYSRLTPNNYYIPGGGAGYYVDSDNPYEGVVLNSNGMTRNWSLTDNDRNLINMSDAEIWRTLTGINVNSKPKVNEDAIYARTVPITVPIWTWKSSSSTNYEKKSATLTLRVNKALQYTIEHIFADIYNDESKPVIIPSTCGSYCYRNISSSGSISTHSYGIAIDLNSSTGVRGYTHAKVYVKSAVPTKAQWEELPESKEKYQLLYRDCPIVCIFKAYGFTWGADWTTSQDAMHFSKVGDLNQAKGQENHIKYYK